MCIYVLVLKETRGIRFSLELEIQVVVSCLMWVLRIDSMVSSCIGHFVNFMYNIPALANFLISHESVFVTVLIFPMSYHSIVFICIRYLSLLIVNMRNLNGNVVN